MGAKEEVLYSMQDRVAEISINRPEVHNTLTPSAIARIEELLAQAERSPDVGAIILRGAGGKAFCTGADLGSGLEMRDASFLEKHDARASFARLLLRMQRTARPILAMVEGYCMAGGLGLCLACDLAIASEDAQFGLPEVKRGLWPYMVTALLMRHVGPKKALELCMTGERISADEAEKLGLITRCVPKGELQKEAYEMARKIASLSPAVLALGKRSFYSAWDLPLEKALDYLASQLTHNTQLEDMAEGISAFLQKREPVWKGR
jgi:enoyl-CoA hydratase/carnithine racemase